MRVPIQTAEGAAHRAGGCAGGGGGDLVAGSGDAHEEENEKAAERGPVQGRIDCRLELKKGLGFHRQPLWGKYTPVAERRLDERGGVWGGGGVSFQLD